MKPISVRIRELRARLAKLLDPTPGRWWSISMPTAGVRVDEDRALALSTVFACSRKIAETIGSLSWHTYSGRGDRVKMPAPELPVDNIIHSRPNPEMSAITFREVLQGHCLLWGNGYAEILRDDAGRPMSMWPITPERVEPRRIEGELFYRVTNSTDTAQWIPARNVFHLKGYGYDGAMGYSVVQYARESMSLGLACERNGAAFFGNSSRPSGVFVHPNKLSDTARDHLKNSMSKGPASAGQTLILEEGMTWQTIGIPPEDAQFLETRKFQVAEICRWFGVPPHKIYDLERATFSNIEHQSIEWVTDTVLPWAKRWEEEADAKLLGPQNRRTHFTRMNLNSLLRGDAKSRNEAYAVGRQWGWLSANDVRELEDMNPIPGGDTYLVPTNMTTTEGMAKMVDNLDKPEPAPPPSDGPQPPDDEPQGGSDEEQDSRDATQPFQRILEDVGSRIAKRRANQLARAVKKCGAAGMAEWTQGTTDDTTTYILDNIRAPVLSLADAVSGGLTPAVERSIGQMLELYARQTAEAANEAVMTAATSGDLDELMADLKNGGGVRYVEDLRERTVLATVLALKGRNNGRN